MIEALWMCGGHYNEAYFKFLQMPVVQFWRYRDIHQKTRELINKAQKEAWGKNG
jgi:hypothetical protein